MQGFSFYSVGKQAVTQVLERADADEAFPYDFLIFDKRALLTFTLAKYKRFFLIINENVFLFSSTVNTRVLISIS